MNSIASRYRGRSDSGWSSAQGSSMSSGINPKAVGDGGLADKASLGVELHPVLRPHPGFGARLEKVIPSDNRLLQDPKFSSKSNRLFGLSSDAVGAVLPIANAVVLAKVS